MSVDRFISTLLYITWMDENPLYIQDSGAFTGTRLKLANKYISLKSGTVFPQVLRRQVRLQKGTLYVPNSCIMPKLSIQAYTANTGTVRPARKPANNQLTPILIWLYLPCYYRL